MVKRTSYLAFFDLDGTILSSNSGKILVRRAYKDGLMSKKELAYGIYLSLLNRFNLRNPARIIEKMAQWVVGLPENELVDFSRYVFDNELKFSIREEIQPEIEYHRKNAAKIVMLSSAVESICQPIAEYLEMDDIISSKLEINNGTYTGKPQGKFCFGMEKLHQLREFRLQHSP